MQLVIFSEISSTNVAHFSKYNPTTEGNLRKLAAKCILRVIRTFMTPTKTHKRFARLRCWGWGGVFRKISAFKSYEVWSRTLISQERNAHPFHNIYFISLTSIHVKQSRCKVHIKKFMLYSCCLNF